jgi:hypothetical protein
MTTKSMFKADTPQGASAEFRDVNGAGQLLLNGVLVGSSAGTGFIAASPAPTYSATGKLLTATIDGLPYVATYDGNDNIATSSYGGTTKTYTWALVGDGAYHIVEIV